MVKLERAEWSSETGNKLTRLFSTLLTRALLHYLHTCCSGDWEQTLCIAVHADTRRNFSVLIGCFVDEEALQTKPFTFEKSVERHLHEGPFPDDDEDMCLEYYGYIIKRALRMFCRDNSVGEDEYPPGFAHALASLNHQKKRFAVDKTDGFGGPELDCELAASRPPEEKGTRRRDDKA